METVQVPVLPEQSELLDPDALDWTVQSVRTDPGLAAAVKVTCVLAT
jgi:hypothetical protein